MNDHTRFIVICITLLSAMAVGGGVFLLANSVQSGELLAQMASSGLSGLVGFLGGKMLGQNKPSVKDPNEVTVTTTEKKTDLPDQTETTHEQ